MKKEFSSSVSWNSAALAGLFMGTATIILDYLPMLPALLGGEGCLPTCLAARSR